MEYKNNEFIKKKKKVVAPSHPKAPSLSILLPWNMESL